MIQVIVCALLTCIVTIGAAFGMMTYNASGSEHAAEEKKVTLVSAKSRMISVPIISENKVQGYVVARFEYVADADLMKASKVPPESVLADEAFKIIYGSAGRDFRFAKKTDVEEVTASVREGVNKRWTAPVIKDVMIDSWSFLRNEEVKRNHEQPKR